MATQIRTVRIGNFHSHMGNLVSTGIETKPAGMSIIIFCPRAGV